MKSSLTAQHGSVFKGVIGFVVVLTIAASVLLYMFGTIVPPGEMGVRQIKFLWGQGFSKVALEPGLHWAVPFYSDVHLVPKTMQILHFNRNGQGDKDPTTFDTLEIQSADRATVDVDLSVLYRFLDAPTEGKEGKEGKDGKPGHGGPGDLFKVGTTEEQWINEVRRRTEDQMKRNLGLLHTAKFYDPVEREHRIADARTALNAALAPSGIKVEALLLRRFSYREDRIDDAIFRKNLQTQEERYNGALAKFTEVKGLVEKLEAELTAKINTINVEAETNVRVIRSEGDLFEAQKKADGNLAVAKAQASVDKLKADSLAQASGSKVYIGREIAPLVGSLRGGIVSDVDPYDLDAWTKKLGVEGK